MSESYCEPAMHEGEKVPADFLVSVLVPVVQPLVNDEGDPWWESLTRRQPAAAPMFACCSAHLAVAVADVARRAAPTIEGEYTIRVRPAR